MAVPILKQGPFLIASIQAALTDTDVLQLRDDVMSQVTRHRSRGIIVDVTALDVMDSFVSRSLRSIAQTLVTLGVDLSKVNAVGDLQGGIEEAERLLGYTVISGAVDKADDRV